jgi:NAD(P)-dependent dehydrogenase (short-subunit alcohol dehydrogenase family)
VPPPAEIADRVHGLTADAPDDGQIHAALEGIVASSDLIHDVLRNNAGGGEANWFETARQEEWHSVDIWRRYVELNLNSVYLSARKSCRE